MSENRFEPISKFQVEFFDIQKKKREKTLEEVGIFIPEPEESEEEEFSLAKIVSCPLVAGDRVKHIKVNDHVLVETNFVEKISVPILGLNEELIRFQEICLVSEAAIVLKSNSQKSAITADDILESANDILEEIQRLTNPGLRLVTEASKDSTGADRYSDGSTIPSSIVRKMVEVEKLPDGAIPYYYDGPPVCSACLSTKYQSNTSEKLICWECNPNGEEE